MGSINFWSPSKFRPSFVDDSYDLTFGEMGTIIALDQQSCAASSIEIASGT
jgi:hypothetical protein